MTGGDQDRLVLRAQAGAPRAFDELLRHYERPLFRHTFRLVGDEDRACEAHQQTFLVLVRSLRRLCARDSFRPWACGVATRVSLESLSRRGRPPEELVEQDAETANLEPLPDSLVSAREQPEAARREVRMLSPKLRPVMLLHFFEGLPRSRMSRRRSKSRWEPVKSRLAAGLEQSRVARGEQR
jgi:RNA polymerase sigma-70 factor (ECF subfamily)